MQMNRRLFRGAHEDVQISCHATAGGYWRMRMAARRSGEGWAEADRAVYEGLTTDELVDVLEATIEKVLGGASSRSGDRPQ
jgi:hypothetical protein